MFIVFDVGLRAEYPSPLLEFSTTVHSSFCRNMFAVDFRVRGILQLFRVQISFNMWKMPIPYKSLPNLCWSLYCNLLLEDVLTTRFCISMSQYARFVAMSVFSLPRV